MGQFESKIFHEVPPWDASVIISNTELTKEQINVCWRSWSSHPVTKKGKIRLDGLLQLLNISSDEDKASAGKLFLLLDKDEDGKVDMADLMLYLFTAKENLTGEQKLKRSYLMYDKNLSGEISKREMLDILSIMGKVKISYDESGKVLIPDDIENLFSLMDVEHDKNISQAEFLMVTDHYRALGRLLTIDLLEPQRREIALMIQRAISTTD